ncbi:MAG: hypothetical protein H7321_05205 [Bacteroidia bacterium]|nr:hypothetical protein [Bacteroidia bacterium]
MLKAGIVGSNISINKYLKVFEKLRCYDFVGYFDPTDTDTSDSIFGVPIYNTFLKQVDAVIFADEYTDTTEDLIIETIKSSKHLITDGFLLRDSHNMNYCEKLNKEAAVCFQVANVESTKPAFTTMLQYLNRVESFKLTRFVNYNKGSRNDDLYRYIAKDVEMALKAINNNVQRVKVSPVSVFNETWDKITIKIDFDNGASADLLFSRLSDCDKAEAECYQPHKYYKADLVNSNCTEVKKHSETEIQLNFNTEISLPLTQPKLAFTDKQVMMYDAFEKDFVNFYDSCLNHVSPLVGIEESRQVIKVIKKVEHALEKLYV